MDVFNVKKMVQIVNHMLKKNNNEMNYIKLLRLLYIADYLCVSKYGFTITEDDYLYLDNGPVLCNLYDFIQGSKNRLRQGQSVWDIYFIRSGDNLQVTSASSTITDDLLTDAEIDILDQIYEKYKLYDCEYIMDHVINDNTLFPTCEKSHSVAIPLSKFEMMNTAGLTEEQIKDIFEEDRIEQERQDFFCK